ADASAGLDFSLRRTYAVPLRIVMALVSLVLVIACANVANLVLARGTARRSELGVRLAIGCSRRRLVAQLVTESVILSAVGTVGGLIVARWGSRLLVGLLSGGSRLDTTADPIVFSFLAAIGTASAMLFGLVPALRLTRVDPVAAINRARGDV